MTDVNTSKTLRRDAAENRQRLLDAAATLFTERGLDVGVDEIAHTAGVGIGTLYRRFPTKDALVSELVRQVLDDFVAAAKEGLEVSGGEGLEAVLYGTGAILASNRGCLSRMWHDDQTAVLRDEYRRILFELLARAKKHDRIRADATESDLDLVFWSVRGVIATTRGVTAADTGWRRIMAIMLAGLRPDAEHLDEDPMSTEHSAQILSTLTHR